MNRQSIFKLFGRKDQVRGKLATLVLGLVVLLPLVLTACLGALPGEREEPIPSQAEEVTSISEEIPATIGEERTSDSAFYAANPELNMAERHTTIVEGATTTGSTFYAANPELMTVERYTAPIVEDEIASESTFYAANPELMTARRYTAETAEK